MRDFTEADRKKKGRRISLPENPGSLSDEALSRLEGAVRAALKNGGLADDTDAITAAARAVAGSSPAQ